MPLTTAWLRRFSRYRRPVTTGAVGLSAVAALSFGAAERDTAGGIAAACGIAALGGLDALSALPRRGSRTVAAAREQDRRPSDPTRNSETKQAVGRIAAGVAHDMNNILQAVIGGLDLVMEEVEADTRARKFAGIALCAAMRGSRLTHHLLCYAGKQMLCPQAIAMAEFLADLKLRLARAHGPHIAIALRVEGAPVAFADPGELETPCATSRSTPPRPCRGAAPWRSTRGRQLPTARRGFASP
jgi:signal transduction histidine kinase